MNTVTPDPICTAQEIESQNRLGRHMETLNEYNIPNVGAMLDVARYVLECENDERLAVIVYLEDKMKTLPEWVRPYLQPIISHYINEIKLAEHRR